MCHIECYEVGTLAVDWRAVTFGTARRGMEGGPSLPRPVLTVPNVTAHTSTHHSCCHAELRKSDLEVTARHLNEVEAVQHVYLTNIPVWFGLLGDI